MFFTLGALSSTGMVFPHVVKDNFLTALEKGAIVAIHTLAMGALSYKAEFFETSDHVMSAGIGAFVSTSSIATLYSLIHKRELLGIKAYRLAAIIAAPFALGALACLRPGSIRAHHIVFASLGNAAASALTLRYIKSDKARSCTQFCLSTCATGLVFLKS